MRKLGLYVHIPFCVRKCAYCDFLSFPADGEERGLYVSALTEEIRARASAARDCAVDTIFFGGGTPSLLKGEDLLRIMREIRRSFRVLPDCEITSEINPGTLRPDLLPFISEELTRVSVGVQSASPAELRSLGRIHTFQEAEEAVRALRACGIGNLSLDLMFGIPGQTLSSWRDTLAAAEALHPEHISCYSLIIEEGTPFAERAAAGQLRLPGEEEERAMAEAAARHLSDAGYRQYEISNWAKPGYACRHNIRYWRLEEYLGFGIGAASFFNGIRWSNEPDIRRYRDCAAHPETLERNRETVTRERAMEEFMFLGLRMTEGVSADGFRRAFGEDITGVYGDALRRHTEGGFLRHDGGRYALTPRGAEVSNVILADYLLED
ncbi:MAG: radical SAM family heme chaperone HemW [Lachnospiraceae bacterium]|nr:radical SAM family heme chaperone HemW [Lachnospiraceae bacterium]